MSLSNWTGVLLCKVSLSNWTGVLLCKVSLYNWTGVLLFNVSLSYWTGVVMCKVSLYKSPVSLGSWACRSIQSFRCFINFLTRLSLRPNSPLIFSRTSSLRGSITSCNILTWRQEKCVLFNALYGVPLDFSTLLYSINSHERVSRLTRLQETPPPPIQTPTPKNAFRYLYTGHWQFVHKILSICTWDTVNFYSGHC